MPSGHAVNTGHEAAAGVARLLVVANVVPSKSAFSNHDSERADVCHGCSSSGPSATSCARLQGLYPVQRAASPHTHSTAVLCWGHTWGHGLGVTGRQEPFSVTVISRTAIACAGQRGPGVVTKLGLEMHVTGSSHHAP